MKLPVFGMDERNTLIVQRICTVFYLVTIAALGVDLLVREFVLKLPVSGYHDIAMIFTANVLLLIGVVLYCGGVTIPRVRPAWLALIYVVCVIAGTVFTAAVHRLASFNAIVEKLKIIAAIWAILIGVYALLAYLANRRTDREISS